MESRRFLRATADNNTAKKTDRCRRHTRKSRGTKRDMRGSGEEEEIRESRGDESWEDGRRTCLPHLLPPPPTPLPLHPSQPPSITLDYTTRVPPRGFHVRTLLLCLLWFCCRILSQLWAFSVWMVRCWWLGWKCDDLIHSFIHLFIHAYSRPASSALRVTGGCRSLSRLSLSCNLDKLAVYCFSTNKVKQLFAMEFTLIGSQFASHRINFSSNRTGAASCVLSVLRRGQSSITGGMCEVITQPNMEWQAAGWRTSPLHPRERGDSTQKRAEGLTWQPGWLQVFSVGILLVYLFSLAVGSRLNLFSSFQEELQDG